jgi:uncharacterized protein YndB with AHSA1/START domain
VVEAPPGEVYDRITDLEHLPDWNAEIPRVLSRPAVLEPEAQWVVEIRAMGTHWNSRSQAVELDRDGGRFGYRSVTDDGNPSFVDWRWEVVADPAGSRVTVEASINPRSFWRRALLARLRRPSLERSMNRSLRALREEVVAR